MRKYMTTFIMILLCLCTLCVSTISVFAIDDAEIKQDGNRIRVSNGGSYKIDSEKEKDVSKINTLLNNYKETITFIGGLATMTMIVLFMKHFIKLAVLGTEHWAIKRNSIMALLWSGLAAALLGGATTVFAISYNLFK